MRRRQFLAAAGVTSTGALTCKKLAAFQTNGEMTPANIAAIAAATEKVRIASTKSIASKCPNLLSPLRIRNVVLKNRIMHTLSPTYFMQGGKISRLKCIETIIHLHNHIYIYVTFHL
jgi:hypothetical protein